MPEATPTTPLRRPGSIRRTSSIDMLRPDGLGGNVVLVGRARDLRTDEAGDAIAGEAGLLARVDFVANRTVTALHVTPSLDTASLIGVPASGGFRGALDRALPGEREARSLAYLLLDDVPVASLVSGYACGAAMAGVPMPEGSMSMRADICAGWRADGTMMRRIEVERRVPVSHGPLASPLARDDDPLAWHRLDPLPPHGMRRHRRLDLWRDGDVLRADVFFRDTHRSATSGEETVVHQYGVTARIDAATLDILEIEAEAQTLPWGECLAAAPSAKWLVGRNVRELRPHVRTAFTGTATCTHLNDTLRSVEDVVALAKRLGAQDSSRR